MKNINKWKKEKDILRTNLARRLFAEGTSLTMSVTKEIDEFVDNDVHQLLTQTQQDILELEMVGKELDLIIYNAKIEVGADQPQLRAYVEGENEMITWYTKRLKQMKETIKKKMGGK